MLPANALFFLASLLILKHFLADGPLQSRYQLANKGRFLHWGGVLHAATHAALTAICVIVCLWIFVDGASGLVANLSTLCLVSALEFSVHYLIDWAKCSLDKSGHWSESTVSQAGQRQLVIKDDMFFHAFLADQMLHSLTYVALVFIVAYRVVAV